MIRAVIFDVFGTCTDWRTSVAREVADVWPQVDALAFADAWRAEYQPAMARIRDEDRGYVPLDQLHLENLEQVCQRFGVEAHDPDALARVWERLDPWPDVVPGLTAIKARHVIAPCSNGSIALMTHLARHAGFAWDCILGAELARDYKPKPQVYLAACAALQMAPKDVLFTAAHNDDLFAARAAGLATAFVPRPTEYGSGQTKDLTPEADWDIVAPDFPTLAERLS